jgi:hypothetical protein
LLDQHATYCIDTSKRGKGGRIFCCQEKKEKKQEKGIPVKQSKEIPHRDIVSTIVDFNVLAIETEGVPVAAVHIHPGK